MNMSVSNTATAVSQKIRLRADVLEETCEKLRSLPGRELRDAANRAFTGLVVVRNGEKYRLRVRVQRTRPDSEDVQVSVTLPAGGRGQPELIKRFLKKSEK